MAPLIERGLMMREGDMYLSLAIPVGAYVPSSKVCERLNEVISELGVSHGGDHVIPAATVERATL